MNSYAIIAIYFLFWVMAAFLVLPFGIKTPDETGDAILPGHADSAPSNFQPLLVIKRATVLAAIMFAIYYANYVYGWITTDSLEQLMH